MKAKLEFDLDDPYDSEMYNLHKQTTEMHEALLAITGRYGLCVEHDGYKDLLKYGGYKKKISKASAEIEKELKEGWLKDVEMTKETYADLITYKVIDQMEEEYYALLNRLQIYLDVLS